MSNHDLIFLNYLAKVFDNLDDSIMLLSVTDRDVLTPLLVNEGFYTHSGRAKGTLQDLVDDITKSDTTPGYIRLCYEAMDRKVMVEEDLPAEVPKGRRYTKTKAIPVLNSLAEVTHLVVISRDTTDTVLKDERIAELERELKQARDVAKKAKA